MFIGAIYIPPIDSKFHDIYDCDLFLELSNCIAKYTELGNILITGDFNARTGSLQDYIQNDSLSSEINDHISEIMCYIPDSEPGPRCTMDKKINTIGRRLISTNVSVNHHMFELLMANNSSTLMGVLPIVSQMDDQLSTYFLQIHSSIYRTLR